MAGLAILLWLLPAVTPDAAEADTTAGATVAEVVDGDTLILADGTEVRLVGIQAPKLPLGRKGFRAQPLAEEARAALARLTAGRELALSYGGAEIDRHGRALAHLHDEAGTWIQGALLSLGLARVYTFRDNRAHVPAMLALECAAREDGRGIWRHAYYRVRSVDASADHIGSFQIVEGLVLDAAVVRGRAYLNFGPDYRTDFTVTIAPRDRRVFTAAGIDPLAYEGRRIRVRGWLKSYNGPVIDATHPEQIEVLGE